MVGVTATNTSTFTAINYDTNQQLVDKCKNKLASLSVGGASNAYVYFAENIPTEDPSKVFTGITDTPIKPVNRVKVTSSSGSVTVRVANTDGVYAANNQYTGQNVYNVFNAEKF